MAEIKDLAKAFYAHLFACRGCIGRRNIYCADGARLRKVYYETDKKR